MLSVVTQSFQHTSSDAPLLPAKVELAIALLILAIIVVGVILRYWLGAVEASDWLLLVGLVVGGSPLLLELARSLIRLQFSSDLLAGVSIVASLSLGEYLAGAVIVLMLSGGKSLENYAMRKASAVLEALSRQAPQVAHIKTAEGTRDVKAEEVKIGDIIAIFPHESCPVDGTVIEGQGSMDESFLTGEPFRMPKIPGSSVISGAINGDAVLYVQATKPASSSRYARIVEVVKYAAATRPQIRRLGDSLGAAYTPLVLIIAFSVWAVTGEALRFLSVVLVATPCPLLIGIPVAVIGSVSLAAKRSIIIKNPAALEQIRVCDVMIFDKTGTLTYGRPVVTKVLVPPTGSVSEVLALTASIECYSKHPLSQAIVKKAAQEGLAMKPVKEMSEKPGQGLRGIVDNKAVEVTGRAKIAIRRPELLPQLPPLSSGLECIVLVDGSYAATIQFHDAPRTDSRSFIQHLFKKHGIKRVVLLSGDRREEVEYLAKGVGIEEVYADKTPEEKLSIVRDITAHHKTVYMGDGVNDAPALMSATVGIAFGHNNDVTTEAADAVIMDTTLQRVDEFFHIGKRMRSVALQSAVGGMVISMAGVCVAAVGMLPPVASALLQEVTDIFAVLNALRAAVPPHTLVDYAQEDESRLT